MSDTPQREPRGITGGLPGGHRRAMAGAQRQGARQAVGAAWVHMVKWTQGNLGTGADAR
jgi:hypothetical protein